MTQPPYIGKAQAIVWAFHIEPLLDDQYALNLGGDLSLVNTEQLRSFLARTVGGRDGLEGDPVARP